MSLYAYVGSRTTRERHARGEGISVFRVEQTSGALELVQVVSDLVNPSYLAISATGSHLYTVHGDQSDVSAFRIDRQSGRLQLLNRQGTEGRNPVHLALDASGRRLVVTNHIGASVAVLPVAADGALGPIEQIVPFVGPLGPHRAEQQQAKPHFNLFDPSGRFVIVPDKGLDRVFSFRLESGRLIPATVPFVQTREGAGPRSLVFHPRQPIAYVVNELDSTVTTYGFDPGTGALTPQQILPTLPSGFTGNSRASGIAIDASGRTVYAANRGHDSVAVFRVDADSGLLEFVAAEASGGRTPRFFTLSPDGSRLYALNEDSDSIVTFAVDPISGRLSRTGAEVTCASPVCMVFSGASC
jgi:6-phosphogluconolactonase